MTVIEHTFTCTDAALLLRPLTPADSERYRLLRNQDQNRRCFFYSDPISVKSQQEWYQNYLRRENDYMFAVCDADGTFLGGAALYDVTGDTAEFGRLIIDQAAAGRSGCGAQALLLLCRLARETLHLTSLHLEVYQDNLPARKTYEKAGFLTKRQYPAPDGMRDICYMEKLL